MSSVSDDLSNALQSFPQCLPSCLLFQENVLSITLLTWRALSQEISMVILQSLPQYTTEWSTISRSSSRYKSTAAMSYVSWETRIMNVQNPFPSVTNEWPFHDHLLNRTPPTYRYICPWRSEKWICRASSPVSPMNGQFKTTFQVEFNWLRLPYDLEDTNNECVKYLP